MGLLASDRCPFLEKLLAFAQKFLGGDVSKSQKKKEYTKALEEGNYQRVTELALEYSEQLALTEKYNRMKLEQFGNVNEAGVIWIEEEQRFRKVSGVPVSHPLPVGSHIRKRSGKAFSHGEKVATIAEIVEHPITQKAAYRIREASGALDFKTVIPA